MRRTQSLLCCALAVVLSSTVWAREPLPLNKAGEPIYVRFHTDYAPVGIPEDLGFKKGDVALVTKIFDAYYLGVARPPTYAHSSDEIEPTPEFMKALWTDDFPRRRPSTPLPRERKRIRRDKVDVISEESALAQAVSERLSSLRIKRAADRNLRELAAKEAEFQERQEQSYPQSLFMGWDKNGNPINGKHTGGGNYFGGWDENGNTINRRASPTGKGNYFMGWDDDGKVIMGR